MKKTMVRIVAALLVAMLALTLIPMGAFAVTGSYKVYSNFINSTDPTYKDFQKAADNGQYVSSGSKKAKDGSVTIDADDYAEHRVWRGALYDLQGVLVKYSNGALKVGDSLTITDKNAHKYPNYFDLIYTTHQHKLSYWYSDGTTHWRECLTCKKYLGHYNQFMYQNWCQDGDEDGICNVCGGDVPYHDVTVIEEEGGKITVNRDNACHRMKITADVEPAEGYKLKKLHFTKIRDDGSEQEITRYKKNGQFWTYMPTYELEVSAEFVKTK